MEDAGCQAILLAAVKRTHLRGIYFNQRRQIVDTLEKHFSPKPSEIVERYKFHRRNRKEDEGVVAYMAELHKLSEHCNFGETLPEMLHNRLVCGIHDKKSCGDYLQNESRGDCFGRRVSGEARC